MQHTLLIASADDARRAFLAEQFDADGHTVHEADSPESTIAKLATHAVDVLLLADLRHPAESPALLRAIRADQHTRIHPAQPVITLGSVDEISTLRAYEAGSDHHLADSTGYFLLRAVLLSVARRALQDITSRNLRVGDVLHIDTAARVIEINGARVRLRGLEFDLLTTMAADPCKVFSRDELGRMVWGTPQVNSRTVESHICRLRQHLSEAGAPGLIANAWGRGYSLLDPTRARQD